MKPTTLNSIKAKNTSRRSNANKQSAAIVDSIEATPDDPEYFQTYFPQNCLTNKSKAKFSILTISLSKINLTNGSLDVSDIRSFNGGEREKNVHYREKGNAVYVESGNIEVRKFDSHKNAASTGARGSTGAVGIVEKSENDSVKRPNLVVLTSKVDNKNVIANLVFKEVKIDNGALKALDSSLEYQKNLESLKFINCNLDIEEIISMKNMFAKYPNITELYVDRNPFNGDNIGVLLSETSSLKFLTLRLCQINDNCVKGIAKELERIPSPLQILNLSSNYITDLGCKYITNALRMNRSLTVLNLSNNFLTDQSCAYFRSALSRFELTPDEIKIKRQELFNRLFLRRKLVKKYTQISTNQFDIKSQRGKSPKRRTASAGAKSSTKTIDSEREKFVNANMSKLTHPFVDDVESKDGAIFCHGNFQLAHLNIAFNKITNSGLKILHSILSYQVNNMHQIGLLGLVNLVFDGNQITYNVMYEIIGEINDFLTLKNRDKSK